MTTRSLKDFLSLSGPDKPKTAALSRAQRLAKVAPPIVEEVLEQRRLLTLTISNVGGTLSVTGTSGADSIDVWIDAFDSIHIDEGRVNQAIYAKSAVTNHLIKVFGAAGNDSINCYGGTIYNVPFPCQIYGDDGNDVIDASDNADTIYGGVGYDTVHAWDSNDVVFGGTGTGAASDSVTGSDSLLGDAGNDTLNGGRRTGYSARWRRCGLHPRGRWRRFDRRRRRRGQPVWRRG